MNLILTTLVINLNEYGDKKGTYTGHVKFAGQYGMMEINLDQKMSQGCLDVCADALVEHSKKMAENMTAAVIEQASVKALASSND